MAASDVESLERMPRVTLFGQYAKITGAVSLYWSAQFQFQFRSVDSESRQGLCSSIGERAGIFASWSGGNSQHQRLLPMGLCESRCRIGEP